MLPTKNFCSRRLIDFLKSWHTYKLQCTLQQSLIVVGPSFLTLGVSGLFESTMYITHGVKEGPSNNHDLFCEVTWL